MESLRVLVCGGNSQTLKKIAQRLSDEGVEAETSTQVIDRLCRTDQEWDLLLIDLSSLTSLLRGLLPAISRQFPNLSMLGIVNGRPPDIGYLSYDLELDGYFFGTPRPEDLIVRLPRLAAIYRCSRQYVGCLCQRDHPRLPGISSLKHGNSHYHASSITRLATSCPISTA